MIDSNGTRTLFFDESGNLGKQGRYFVIACIDTYNPKELHNIMKKKIGQAKEIFPNMKHDTHEVKASNSYPAVKHHILECITRKDLSISYIVADLNHVYSNLLEDKNLLYNYMCKILIDKVIGDKFKNKKLNLRLDNKTVKVNSINSFSDYIKVYLNYEKLKNLDLDVKHIDSNSKYSYTIQAADYVANAVYSYYEYNNSSYYDIIKNYCNIEEVFPKSKFGQLKAI